MILKSKNLLLLSILLILFAGAFILFGHNGFAGRLANFVFYLLVTTLVIYIWEARNEK